MIITINQHGFHVGDFVDLNDEGLHIVTAVSHNTFKVVKLNWFDKILYYVPFYFYRLRQRLIEKNTR